MIKLILTLLFLLLGCTTKPRVTFSDIDIPFKVIPNAVKIPLPLEAGALVKNGKAIFHFYIEPNGKMIGINIAYLSFYDFDGKQIFRETMSVNTVVAKSDYPPKIKDHYDFLINFARRSKVIKVGKSEDGRMYLYRLPLPIGEK